MVLLFSQPEKNHIGLRRKLKKITMGYGKEMGKVKTRLAKRPLADVQKHLKAIKTKVTKILDNTNAKKEWTRDQATMIIQMINAIEADYKSYKTHDIGNSLDRKNATPWNKSNTHMSKWINENQTFNIKN
ncbi:MAG: hypothetical protein LBH96_04550 [Candidatus Peribacteria bacterium]|nr:hypothetical protein [Candidatus Peribacteria bacterium]